MQSHDLLARFRNLGLLLCCQSHLFTLKLHSDLLQAWMHAKFPLLLWKSNLLLLLSHCIICSTANLALTVVRRKEMQGKKNKRPSTVHYLSLYSTHACTLSINSLVCEPQASVNVLDVTHRVAIFNVRYAHPIHFLLHTRVQLFLNTKERKNI